MNEIFNDTLNESIKIREKLIKSEFSIDFEKSISLIVHALKANNKILVFGNGGSASDSQHFVAELVVKFSKIRKSLPAISLCENSSILTACGNDFDFDQIFSKQIEGLGRKNDIAIGITTSGKSKNIYNGLEKALQSGLKTICLNGKEGGLINSLEIDSNLIIPSNNTARIQEIHITLIHIWCQIIDLNFK